MSPDCQYCGLEDGASIEHKCVNETIKSIIDNAWDNYHEQWNKVKKLESGEQYQSLLAVAEQMAEALQSLVYPYHTALGGGTTETQSGAEALSAWEELRRKE